MKNAIFKKKKTGEVTKAVYFNQIEQTSSHFEL